MNRGRPTPLVVAAAVIVILLLGIVVLLALNVLKTPASSPAPSPSAHLASPTAPTPAGSPNGSSVPSAVPPSAGATPFGSPSSGYQPFLLHVPEAIRASCSAGETSQPTPLLFSARCSSSDGIIVSYGQYADAASMEAAYQSVFTDQQIDAGTGSCEDHGTWPAEGPYNVENQPVGRRLCADQQGSPTIYWTDERLDFYSSATGPDPVRLIQFWTNEAGPIQ